MRKVLITGVAGFIGSHVSRRFIDEGFGVVGLDDISTGSLSNLTPGVEFHGTDLRDSAALASVIENQHFEAVVHLAAQSGGEPSMRDPANDASRNILATLNLVQLLQSEPPKRFVFASSAAVYGDSRSDDESSNWTSPAPNSFYGLSKLAAESYLNLFARRTNTLVSALRFFNVYGPGQDLTRLDQGMVSIYLAQMLKGSKVTIKGSTQRVRDFIHVQDVVDAVFLSATKSSFSGAFDVCTGTSNSVEELLTQIELALGKKCDYEEIEGTEGDSQRWYGDPSPLRAALGWVPRIDLVSGIRSTVAWSLSRITD